MGFDLQELASAIDRHGRVARVVIAATHGSSPREVGAAMLVWLDGQSGTVGGGELEYRLAEAARRQTAPARLTRHALGPEMGQCCGGAVEVLTEFYDRAALTVLEGQSVIARPVSGEDNDMPLAVRRLLGLARSGGRPPVPQLVEGWMIEPVALPATLLWVWGAGHVGRAIVSTAAPLPEIGITWVDTAEERFPETIPEGVRAVPAQDPARLAAHAPVDAHHLVLTYSHALDLALCHALLTRGFASAGLIGSGTKWARFRKRLTALGHSPDRIARIRCPIGDPGLGKHPQAIAIGVAAELIRSRTKATPLQEGKSA